MLCICINFVEAQGTSELQECYGLALASLQRLLYRGGVLKAFVHAVSVSYITTVLNWDFTFLSIT